MNFKQWSIQYFSWVENPDPKDIESHKIAWDTCKKEVLKILENNIKKNSSRLVKEGWLNPPPIDNNVIEKIKKL